MAGRLEDKVAIVTGSGRGVGRAIARLMAQEGARVVIADNGSNVDGTGGASGPAEETAAEINAEGGTAIAIACDVSDWDQSREMVQAPIDRWGKLDILVNNAGNFRINTVADVTREDWEALKRVHGDGMMYSSHFASLHWKERRQYGRLINFTSDSFMSGVPDTFAYGAVKGIVVGLTRAAANALASYNVTANCMTQATMTRMGAYYYAGGTETNKGVDTAPADQRPETVAPLVVYLASPAAAHISGRIFGSYGFQYIRWSEPKHEATLDSEGPWQTDHLFDHFDQTLGKGLSLENDLQWPMESLDQEAGAAGIDLLS